jgi:hypothetical protein
MSVTGGLAMTLAALLVAPPEPAEVFSPGIGYTVSEDLRRVEMIAGSPAETTVPARLAPRLPPPSSDLARVQGSPRARGMLAAAAVAAQLAMIVAGVVSVRNQREQARRDREGQVQPYRPYR